MGLSIFTEPGSWILKRSAQELEKRIPGARIVDPRSPGSEVNYFVNYALFRALPGKSLCLFTHVPHAQGAKSLFYNVARRCDYAVSLCRRTDSAIAAYVAPARRRVIMMGSSLGRPVRFGVVGRVYPDGRKGEHLVSKMVKAGLDVVAWGSGWPCRSAGSDYTKIADFYKEITYLVVTSLNEGGPVPVLDAIASGVPVIAPDVGWCWDFPVIKYTTGSWESLWSVVHKLARPRRWEDWAKEHRILLEMVYQHAASRT